MSKNSSRAIAAQIILQVLDHGKSLSSLLPEAQSQLSSKDIALVQEIVFGICRVLPRLEAIIQLLVNKPLKGKMRLVHCLLLVGLYQLLYMRVPTFAAVDEVVNATKNLKLERFSALTNGVLRRFLREQVTILKKVDQHWQTLHPDWLVNRLKKAYPLSTSPHWRDVIEANNQRPPMWIRVNQTHITTEDYAHLLADLADTHVYSAAPICALKLASAQAVSSLPHFANGWATIQDVHAQWAALLLEPQNGEKILDACAAPGGKTTHILECAPLAKVTALDVDKGRLVRVAENLQRLGQTAQIICVDATEPKQWLEDGVLFDRILLDAPCSATGVIRRHPDIKWLRKESDIDELVQLQAKILNALWQCLKPNGVLLYATCSIMPEENQQQIERFLAQTPSAELLEMQFNGERRTMMQFLPSPNGGDGFFYAKLRKTVKKGD